MIPGEFDVKKGSIDLNAGKDTVVITVSNTADRPIQVGSHYHFYEVNSKLKFDRKKAYGKRLNIPAGASVRFEPGQSRDVELVSYGGAKKAVGFRGKVMGSLADNDPEEEDEDEKKSEGEAPAKPKGDPQGD
jgi:urease beta subunit